MPRGVYERKAGHNIGKTKGGVTKLPPWEKTFRLAIKQATDAGEMAQAKKIQLRFNAAQRDMEIMDKTKKRGVAAHRIGQKLGTQYKAMVQRLIKEVDMFNAADPEATLTNRPETVAQRNNQFTLDKAKLGLIKEIISVVRALRELKGEHEVGIEVSNTDKEEADETESLIKDAEKALKYMGIGSTLN